MVFTQLLGYRAIIRKLLCTRQSRIPGVYRASAEVGEQVWGDASTRYRQEMKATKGGEKLFTRVGKMKCVGTF